MEDNEVIINVSHLTKDYGFGRGVFDVSIQVHKGECYGYLGPNGAGKSTTIRHIMGFSRPQKGSIQVFGKESFSNTDYILGRVGYLPGEIALPSGLNGWDFLHMMQKMRDSTNNEHLQYLLKKFKLDPDANPKEMSLGDKRKLAVVAAFMDDPDVLILDEPTSGLDPVMQKVFIDFIIEERQRGKTILMSSHIFSEVDKTCDTITIIKDGHHVSTIKAEELKHRDQKTYLLTFNNHDDLLSFKKSATKYTLAKENELSLTYDVNKKDIHDFIVLLAEHPLAKFEENKYTLEDYFMNFYKEDKKFTGLEGIQEGDKK
jgi:ABC-2 type transport system ATP-binding protein